MQWHVPCSYSEYFADNKVLYLLSTDYTFYGSDCWLDYSECVYSNQINSLSYTAVLLLSFTLKSTLATFCNYYTCCGPTYLTVAQHIFWTAFAFPLKFLVTWPDYCMFLMALLGASTGYGCQPWCKLPVMDHWPPSDSVQVLYLGPYTAV